AADAADALAAKEHRARAKRIVGETHARARTGAIPREVHLAPRLAIEGPGVVAGGGGRRAAAEVAARLRADRAAKEDHLPAQRVVHHRRRVPRAGASRRVLPPALRRPGAQARSERAILPGLVLQPGRPDEPAEEHDALSQRIGRERDVDAP